MLITGVDSPNLQCGYKLFLTFKPLICPRCMSLMAVYWFNNVQMTAETVGTNVHRLYINDGHATVPTPIR